MNTDFFSQTQALFQSNGLVDPWVVLARLLVALLLGAVVAWVYRRTAQNRDSAPSFPMTLVLLSVLIAMVTQVIGSNVALAFSLVGALSVVRFRTIVRDTRDTAYVIFAVVVGMAVGAANLWVAVLGIVVIAVASWIVKSAGMMAGDDELYALRLRCPVGQDPLQLIAAVTQSHLNQCRVAGVSTSKQGMGLDYHLVVSLRAGVDLPSLVGALALIEGVQDVRIERAVDD